MTPPKKRAPCAYITVKVLEDPEHYALFQTQSGQAAFGIFVSLVVAAKKATNLGTFFDMDSAAISIHIKPDVLKKAVQKIHDCCIRVGSEPWISLNPDGRLIIRNWAKWNDPRGGSRPGAGRPPGPPGHGSDNSIPDSIRDSIGNQNPSPPRARSVSPPTGEGLNNSDSGGSRPEGGAPPPQKYTFQAQPKRPRKETP